MSFEGYYQILCERGHLSCVNVYYEPKKCFCGKRFVWWHIVDETNDEGKPKKLRVKLEKSCKHCKTVLETIYHIPKTRKLES